MTVGMAGRRGLTDVRVTQWVGGPELVDRGHELADALDVDMLGELAVLLEEAADDGAVGHRKHSGDVVRPAARVAEDGDVEHGDLHLSSVRRRPPVARVCCHDASGAIADAPS